MDLNQSESPLFEPILLPPGKHYLFSPKHALAVYTVLSVLIKMQKELGLEAMLEYMNHFLNTVDKNNPRVQFAVSRALQLISVDKIYRETSYEKTE